MMKRLLSGKEKSMLRLTPPCSSKFSEDALIALETQLLNLQNLQTLQIPPRQRRPRLPLLLRSLTRLPPRCLLPLVQLLGLLHLQLLLLILLLLPTLLLFFSPPLLVFLPQWFYLHTARLWSPFLRP